MGNTVDIVSINVLREKVGLVVTTEMSSYIAICSGMVMSSVNTIISKCVKLQNRRLVGKKTRSPKVIVVRIYKK